MGKSEAGSDNDNRDPEIVLVLIRLAKKTRTVIGLRLAEIGLATGEDDVLMALRPGETVAIASLASELAVRAPTVTRSAERLAARGLLDFAGPAQIRITTEGVSLQQQISAVHMQIASDLARSVDMHKLAGLTAELGLLDASLSRALTKMV